MFLIYLYDLLYLVVGTGRFYFPHFGDQVIRPETSHLCLLKVRNLRTVSV